VKDKLDKDLERRVAGPTLRTKKTFNTGGRGNKVLLWPIGG